jgi:hypothetical protein
MQTKIVFATIFFASLLLFSSTVLADVTIKPAKLGIVRLNYQPLFPTLYQGTFQIGNTYNFTLNVSLQPDQNISSVMSLSETNFLLQPNQTETLEYTIKPTSAGVYQGSVTAIFTAGPDKPTVAYQDEITIIVNQSDSYYLVLAAIGVVAVIIAVSFLVMRKKSKARGRK